jgi:hypothetical protein
MLTFAYKLSTDTHIYMMSIARSSHLQEDIFRLNLMHWRVFTLSVYPLINPYLNNGDLVRREVVRM